MPYFRNIGVLDIHEEAVQSYIRTGGEVADLLDDVARGVKRYSERFISNGHYRSGRLYRGLFFNKTKAEGPLQGFSRAGSSARHTEHFYFGTAGNGAGYISHPNMIVPKNRNAAHTNLAFKGAGAEQLAQARGNREVTKQSKVRGQRGKPFLEQGLAVSLAEQRLV